VVYCVYFGRRQTKQLSRTPLDRRRVIAPPCWPIRRNTLSIRRKEFCACNDLLYPAFSWTTWLSSPWCQAVLSRFLSWLKSVGLGGQELVLTWPKRECLLRLIASYMDGSKKRVAMSSFVTYWYQRMPSIRLWFVIWKASSFAISAFNIVHVLEAFTSDDRTHEL